MKKFNHYVSACFIAVTLITTVAGCSSNAQHESTGQYVDDSAITTKVKSALFAESSLKSAEINVETYKGVVQLSGFVRSQANISTAINTAKGVEGVKSVKNDMHLKP